MYSCLLFYRIQLLLISFVLVVFHIWRSAEFLNFLLAPVRLILFSLLLISFCFPMLQRNIFFMQPTLSRANFINFRSIMLRTYLSSIPRCTKLSFHTQSYRQFEDCKNETIGYRTKHFTIIIWLLVVSYLVSMFNTILFSVTKMCINCKH